MSPTAMTVDTPMDLSTKTRRKLRLEEFLRQNLDQAPAARVIQWVNREQGVFRILWTHQSSGAFTQQDAALFRYWALARGKPASLSSVELKQSLRMALNKSPSVERLTSFANDEYRYFRFTDWASRRRSLAGVKSVRGQQQEGARRKSPPPGLPPPLVPIVKRSPPSPAHWTPDHLTLLTQAEKPLAPYTEDMLRELLGTYSMTPLFGRPHADVREDQQGDQQEDKYVTHNHLGEQRVFVSPKHLTPKNQLAGDNTQELGLTRGQYLDYALTVDYRIREKVLREPSTTGSHLLGEHLRYLPKARSPQAYSEPPHAVPSYMESLPRQDLEVPFSLYGDCPYIPKSFPYYDYRAPSSSATAAAHRYSVPDQALAAPIDASDSRLLSMQY